MLPFVSLLFFLYQFLKQYYDQIFENPHFFIMCHNTFVLFCAKLTIFFFFLNIILV
jgi:hypothetical protein